MRRRVIRRRETDRESGIGLTHQVMRTTQTESPTEPPYPRGSPEFIEWLRTPEGMAWVRSHRKEKKGGRKPKLASVPKTELWRLKYEDRSYKDIIAYLKRNYDIEVSKRTLIRWYQENKIPKDFTIEKDIRNTIEWQRWIEAMKYERPVTKQTSQNRQNIIIRMWKFLNKKPPSLWSLEDIKKFIRHLHDQGYASNTMRSYLISIRSFVADGLQKEGWLRKLSVSPYPKETPTIINYFPKEEINKMIDNIPPVGYPITYKFEYRGKERVHTVTFNSQTERLEMKAMIRMFMSTCARIGGLKSIKIKWINFDQGILEKIIEKGRGGKVWERIRLTPRCMEALRQYLMARYNMKEWNPQKLILEHGEDKLFPKDDQDYRERIYAIIQFSLDIGDPILDQFKVPWTPERMREEKHVAHLFRKSFVQNLRREGLHLEQIADLGVGWDDLSTMRKYYGKTPESEIEEIWQTKLSKLF